MSPFTVTCTTFISIFLRAWTNNSISPFHNLQLVDLIFWHHRVVAEIRYHLHPAAGAEAYRRRAVGSGHRAEGHRWRGGGGGECQVFSVPEKKVFTPLAEACALSFQDGGNRSVFLWCYSRHIWGNIPRNSHRQNKKKEKKEREMFPVNSVAII